MQAVKEEARVLWLRAGSEEGGEERRLEGQAVQTRPRRGLWFLSQVPEAFGLRTRLSHGLAENLGCAAALSVLDFPL